MNIDGLPDEGDVEPVTAFFYGGGDGFGYLV